MKGVKTPLSKAQEVKEELIKKDLINLKYKPVKEKDFIIFPVKKNSTGFEMVSLDFEKQKEKIKDLKSSLKEDLTSDELEILKTSYDTVGSIAILEIDEELRNVEKLIGKRLLEVNHNIRTVLRKDDKHEGPYRNQKFKFLAGENTTVTVHKENGVLIKVDLAEMYYSPRLGNDRLRIAKDVKKGEIILVIGSGCGPYPLVFSKKSLAHRIVGVDLNPKGYEFALINKELNKAKNVEFILADGAKYLKNSEYFNRIVLATPDNSDDFIELAFQKVRKGKIHYNFFSKLAELDVVEKKLLLIGVKQGKKIKITFFRNGHHAPYVYRMSADIEVL